MATNKKKVSEKIKQTLSKSKVSQKLVILHMPEHSPETAPHWLFWLLIIGLVALVIAMMTARFGVNPTIQTYLPGI